MKMKRASTLMNKMNSSTDVALILVLKAVGSNERPLFRNHCQKWSMLECRVVRVLFFLPSWGRSSKLPTLSHRLPLVNLRVWPCIISSGFWKVFRLRVVDCDARDDLRSRSRYLLNLYLWLSTVYRPLRYRYRYRSSSKTQTRSFCNLSLLVIVDSEVRPAGRNARLPASMAKPTKPTGKANDGHGETENDRFFFPSPRPPKPTTGRGHTLRIPRFWISVFYRAIDRSQQQQQLQCYTSLF